jgi:hypothetical protein
MQSRTLYIVGNGFDLYHDIPSSYRHFRDYVRGVDRSIYSDVQDYLSTEEEWSDLESSLANFDVDLVVDKLGHFMASYGSDEWSDSAHHDFQYEVGQLVERLSSGLRARFADWIMTLPIPTPATSKTRLQHLNATARFFNFNYTSTLGSLYGVDPSRILFIHGCAARGDDLILGHAWNPTTRPALNEYVDPESEDTRLMEANDEMDAYFSATFKHCDQNIAQHQTFLESLTDVDQVVVLGHGLADVDAAYFRALLGQPSISQARWLVASRPTEDPTWKMSRLALLGVDPARADCVPWDAL